jgi:phosphoglycolate phosphatase
MARDHLAASGPPPCAPEPPERAETVHLEQPALGHPGFAPVGWPPVPAGATLGRERVKPRLFIFDFDGTLADSFGCFLDVADAVADRYRCQRLDRRDLEGLRALNARQLMARQRIAPWKLPFMVRHARALMAREIQRVPLFAGMSATLADLAGGGATLGMVTTNSRSNVLRVLGPATAALFGELECGVSLCGKARKLRRVLRRTGIPPAQALFVGDELRDAVAARAAGVPFGAVAWGYARLDVLLTQAPARVFHRVEDLRGS